MKLTPEQQAAAIREHAMAAWLDGLLLYIDREPLIRDRIGVEITRRGQGWHYDPALGLEQRLAAAIDLALPPISEGDTP